MTVKLVEASARQRFFIGLVFVQVVWEDGLACTRMPSVFHRRTEQRLIFETCARMLSVFHVL